MFCHLFRHDQLDEAVRFLEGRVKAKLDLGRSNVSPTREVALSAPMAARLREEAPEEFALWTHLGG